MTFVNIVIYCLLIQVTKCSWVDPFDMLGYNHATKSCDQTALENAVGIKIPEKDSCNSIEERIFIKRFINLILENSGITKENTLSLLEVKIDINKLKDLQNMLKTQNFSLQELDQTISSAIFPYKLPKSCEYSTLLSWPSSETWHLIFVLSTGILPCAAFFVFNGLKKIVGFTLLILLPASYFIVYQKLLQEAQINQLVLSKNIPENCLGDQSTLWNSIKNFLSTDDSCAKYLHALNIDAKYHVDPYRVWTHVLSEPFMHLMVNFGHHFSKFSNNIFGGVHWLYVPIVYICCLIFMLCAGFGAIALLCGQNIKLFGIQIFQRNQNVSRNGVSLPRQMIEEILTAQNGEGKDIAIEGGGSKEIDAKINNYQQYKCDKCQEMVNATNVQNSGELPPFQISKMETDEFVETID